MAIALRPYRARFPRPELLAALVSLLFTATAAGQEVTWAKIFNRTLPDGKPGALRGTSLSTLYDGTVAASAVDGCTFNLTKIGPKGDVIWSKSFHCPAGDPRGSWHDGNRPLVAEFRDGCVVAWGSFLVWVDREGNYLKAKDYSFRLPGDRNRYGFKFTSLVQGHWGSLAVSGENAGSSDRHKTVFAAALNEDGSVGWTKWFAAVPEEYGGLQPLSQEGYVLGCTSLGNGSEDGYLGVKLYRLDGQGNVVWCNVYYDDKALIKPPSSYGGIQGFVVGNADKIYVSKVRYDMGWGSTIFTASPADGTPGWSQWIAGRKGGGETRIVSLFPAGFGRLAFAGRTTEFSDLVPATKSHWLLGRMTSGGTVEWMETIGGYSAASDGAESIGRTTINGGPIAAGWADSLSDVTGLMVVSTGQTGQIAGIAEYLTKVDLGKANGPNPKLRLETPPLHVGPGSIRTGDATFDVTDAVIGNEAAALGGGDFGGDAGAYSLEPLFPHSAGIPSRVMKGGTAYRYFQLKNATGSPVEKAEVRYVNSLTGAALRVTSGDQGEVAFGLPTNSRTEIKTYASGLTVSEVRVGGRRRTVSGQPVFSVEVLPLTYSTNWTAGNGTNVKAGLGIIMAGAFGTVQQKGGLTISRTANDPERSGAGSLGIATNTFSESGGGLEGGFEFKGKIGPAKAKGLDASISLTSGPFTEFSTLFHAPADSSASEKLAETLAFLTGVSNATSSGTTQVLSVAINLVTAALSSRVEVQKLMMGVGTYLNGSVSGIKFGVETKAGQLNGLGLGNLSGKIGGQAAVTFYPIADEVGAKATLVFDAGVNIVQALGFNFGEAKLAGELTLEFVFSTDSPAFKRLRLTVGGMQDARGEVQALTYDVTPALLGPALGDLIQMSKDTWFAANSDDTSLVLDSAMVANVLRAVAGAVNTVQVPFERAVVMDKKPTELDLSLGIDVGGNQIELGIKPTFGRYQSFPLERGVFVPLDRELHIARQVVLEHYPTSLFSAMVDSLPDMAGELLEVVGDLFLGVWNVVGGWLSDTVGGWTLDVGAGLGGEMFGGAEIVFEAGTGLFGDLLSGAGRPAVDLASLLQAPHKAPAKKPGRERVTLASTVPRGHPFIIGGLYAVQPGDKRLSKPAKLILKYADRAAGSVDPGTFGLYRFESAKAYWARLPAEHDRAARSLSGDITRLGEFAIGSDSAPPAFALRDAPQGGTVLTGLTRLVIFCRDEGSGIDPGTVSAALDGGESTVAFRPLSGEAVVGLGPGLTEGPHRISVRAMDGAGNEGRAEFELVFTRPTGEKRDSGVHPGGGEERPEQSDGSRALIFILIAVFLLAAAAGLVIRLIKRMS